MNMHLNKGPEIQNLNNSQALNSLQSIQAEIKAYEAYKRFAEDRLSGDKERSGKYVFTTELSAERFARDLNTESGSSLFSVIRSGNTFNVIADPSRLNYFTNAKKILEE